MPASKYVVDQHLNYLTVENLKDICKKKKLLVIGRKDDIIDRLVDDKLEINDLNVEYLKKILKELDLKVSGNKDELIQRLMLVSEKKSKSPEANLRKLSKPTSPTPSSSPKVTVSDLKAICKERGLMVSGKKDDLIKRLLNDKLKFSDLSSANQSKINKLLENNNHSASFSSTTKPKTSSSTTNLNQKIKKEFNPSVTKTTIRNISYSLHTGNSTDSLGPKDLTKLKHKGNTTKIVHATFSKDCKVKPKNRYSSWVGYCSFSIGYDKSFWKGSQCLLHRYDDVRESFDRCHGDISVGAHMWIKLDDEIQRLIIVPACQNCNNNRLKKFKLQLIDKEYLKFCPEITWKEGV
eukprot:Pgem_evm1s18423